MSYLYLRFINSLLISISTLFFIVCTPSVLSQNNAYPQLNPNSNPNPRAVSLYNLGLAAHKQGSPESAIIFFKRACDIDPNLADAQYNLGVLYQMQKRFKEAIPRYEEVLRLKPGDPDAHFQLGIIFQDTGNLFQARNHLSSIAPNNPHFSEAQKRLALLANAQAGQSMDPALVQAQVGGQAPSLQPAFQQSQGQTPVVNADTANTSVYGQINPLNSMQVQSQPQVQAQTSQNNTYQQSQVSTNPSNPSSSSNPLSQLPATAYIPGADSNSANTNFINSANTMPQVASTAGPIPVMANSSLRIIASGFSAPSGLAFDKNGNLYVANYMTNSIDRIGVDGTKATFCAGANLRGPIGLVADDSNNLFVANYNSGTVVKVSPAGISNIVASGFKKPYYLTLDKEGNLYVSQQEDNSVVRITLPRNIGSKVPSYRSY